MLHIWRLLKIGIPVILALLVWLASAVETTPLTAKAVQSSSSLIYLPFIYKGLPPVDWDPRLGPGGLPHLENVRIIPAPVESGQKFWRVVRAKFEDYYESGNDHTIYVKVLDENGNRTTGKQAHFTSYGGISEYPEEKSAGDSCDCNFNLPMYTGDVYAVGIEDLYVSDTMAGMIMPLNRHVNYRITFQFSTSP